MRGSGTRTRCSRPHRKVNRCTGLYKLSARTLIVRFVYWCVLCGSTSSAYIVIMWLSFVQVHCYSSAKLCLQVIYESFFLGSDIIDIMYIYRKFHNFVVGPYAQCRELFVFLYYTHIYIYMNMQPICIYMYCVLIAGTRVRHFRNCLSFIGWWVMHSIFNAWNQGFFEHLPLLFRM